MTGATRWEMAMLAEKLPKVLFASTTVRVLFGSFKETCVWSLNQRPSERTVQKDCLAMEGKNNTNPFGVHLLGFGKFSENGLSELRRFCSLKKPKDAVQTEEQWLQNTGIPNNRASIIQKVLWHQSPHKPILQHHRKSMDSINLSYIVEEGYIDNFVIDITISKFLEDAQKNVKYDTLYLPIDFLHGCSVQTRTT